MSEIPSHHGVMENSLKGENYPNETIKLLLERASCRNYQDREIPEDVLDYVLRARNGEIRVQLVQRIQSPYS